MAVAVVLVGLLPFGFVYTMLWLVNTVGLELLEWATNATMPDAIHVPMWIVVVLIVLGFMVQFRLGDDVALRSVGAERVAAADRPELVGRLDRLAQTADIPTPELAVADTDVPNAFAIGHGRSQATVVVTSGLLDVVADAELDAILAHEIAHIKNRDMTVMSLAYFLPTVTYMVAMFAFGLLQAVPDIFTGFADGHHHHHTDGDDVKGLLVALVVLTVSAALTLAVSMLFWLGSFVLFRVLSQYREYAADRGAAAITGNPMALASALRTINDDMTSAPDEDLRETDGGLEALYIAPVEGAQFGDERALISGDVFPDTHPPTGERVQRLQELDAGVEE